MWITIDLLAEVSAEARESPRHRRNRNFHAMEDPVHRLVNALEPATYVRPHRHLDPAKCETAVALAGSIGVLVFDDAGGLVERRAISPGGPVLGAEMPPGAWHTFVSLAPGSVFFEAKAGPYAPPGPDEVASWAPAEGTPEAVEIERRWRTLFSPISAAGASTDSLEKSYDLVASDYAAEYSDELAKKPFDRKMLDWLAEKSEEGSVLCDMGCGPGQIAGYLHSRGARACGVDLSSKMVAEASSRHPGIPFTRGDMRALTRVADGAWGGIAAFYSLIHLPRADVVPALRELRRTLSPEGVILAALHIGRETIHRDEWWGKQVSIDFSFFETEEMKAWMTEAGFRLEESIERDPCPDVEYPSRRAYLFARNAG